MVPGGARRNPADPNANSYFREQDSIFGKMKILSDLERQPPVKFGDILAVSGPVLDTDPLMFDLRIDYFRQSDDRVIAVFTMQAENNQFKFEPVGGVETAKLNIIGRLTAVSGKRAGVFEDSITTSATGEELASMRQRSSIYQKAVALPPGKYKIDLGLRDVVTGNKGVNSLGFEVPRYDAKKLSTSTLVLASKIRATEPTDIGDRFVIGSAKVIPNLTGRFKQGQEVGVYLQVYNAGIDQTTLRPAVDVDYLVTKNGKEVFRKKEDWGGMSDSSQRLTLTRLLPTARLDSGEYEIRVIVKDRVGGETIEHKNRFTVEK